MVQGKIQEAPAQPTPTENGGAQAQPQQPTPQQPQARPCPQDCRMCGINQQVFCATKMLFDLSRRQQVLEMAVGEITKALIDIRAQLQKKGEATELSIPFAGE
jgi:hypothetical protein